jgi:ferredoxin
MYLKITPKKLIQWLDGLKAQAEVLTPAKVDGVWTYTLSDLQTLPQHYFNSRIPPKSLFFPSLQALLGWRSSDGSLQLSSTPPPDGQRAILGLRPCDARALRILEPVFLKDYQDVFYSQNLLRTLLLGQACQAQCEGSFCEEMGIDPQDSADVDLFFREIPGGYLVKVVTEKGKNLAGAGDFFEESSEKEWNAGQREIRGRRDQPLFDLERVKAGAGERFPDEDFWRRVSDKCINCGVCTYLCPTCHCFDLCDLQMPGQGVRFRCFDSCAFPGFTKMAVHNPREEKWRRYRQRVNHKFNFFYQNFQNVACVGCGRCVIHCPVNLDLREVLLAIAR